MLRALLVLTAVTCVAAIAAVFWGRAQLRGSLPRLEGEYQLPGLTHAVRVTRDALGVPGIRAANRADAARATGFLHAQDRFFQMDLSRRRAAGELAALVGERALPADRSIRIHRFRAQARRAVELLDAGDRAVLDAYTAGVNAGLQALERPPFEYLVLRQQPAQWRLEDTLLVVLAMFITLQDDDGSYEAAQATMHDVLPGAMVDFLAPRGTDWDAPVVGPAFELPPIPGEDVYDLRSKRTGKPAVPVLRPPAPDEQVRAPAPWPVLGMADDPREEAAIGSNSFVVSGRLTSDGRPLLANDMHLTIRVPNTWYRVSMEWGQGSDARALAGVTLPGVPAMVVGSNAHVAWGFTNSYADWSDVVLLDIDAGHPDGYRTPDGWREFDRYDEIIEVAGGAPEHLPVVWTIWGPLLQSDRQGRQRAYRWVAHSAEQLAAALRPVEDATNILEAFDSANGIGAPGQNMVAADSSGRIGWTIYGSIPRRVGFDGRVPVSWADGQHKWDGWLSDGEYPRILDPASGRIWTANARVVDGDMLAKLGDGNYEIGSRAHIIRDRLFARERFGIGDLLDIQLDTRASFLERWRGVLLKSLSDTTVNGNADRALVRDIVDKEWSGHASPQSAAYRLVRAFRESVSARVVGFVLSECYEADPAFRYTAVRRRDGPIWQLVTGQPQHLLDPRYETWNDLLLASVDDVIEQSTQGGGTLRMPWSEYNVVAFRHPLSGALPFVSRWLDMPQAELPGDLFTPRMHWGAVGPSERMIVSPGSESTGMLHMPTGQSGHPLSPFYANSHPAWVEGKATSLLPGQTVYTLTLRP